MNKLKLAIGVLSMACTGLASAAQEDAPAPAHVGPAVQAGPAAPVRIRTPRVATRMRIIDDAHVDVRFFRKQACYSGTGVVASRAGGLPAVFRRKKVVSIGIPVTPAVEAMKERSGFMSNAFYREYALAPGEPVVIQAGYLSGAAHMPYVCRFPAVTFVPDKGSDYEVETRVGEQSCHLLVGRIDTSEGKVNVVPVALTTTSECAQGE